MKVIVIIQARLGSTRLPGKVLLPLGEQHTALSYMLERVKKSHRVDDVIVATTDQPADRKLIEYLESIGAKYFAGSEKDVLDRYYQAAKQYAAPGDVIVRMTGDCPFADPKIIDKLVDQYQSGEFDFVSNSLEPYSFPDGMDVEVFSFENLERAWKEATLPSHREHVTFYFWQNPELFKIYYVKHPENLSQLRLTLDYREDYEMLKQIADHFSSLRHSDFGMNEIVAFLKEHPEIVAVNAHIQHNQGWQSAFEEDKKFLNS